MKMISSLARAVSFGALALGGPVLAQGKDAGGFRLSQVVLKPAQAADAALTRGDVLAAQPLVVQAETAAVSDGDRYVAAALRYRLETAGSIAQPATTSAGSNQLGVAKALDTLIASPVTPQADRARFVYHRAQLAYRGRQYQVANDLFTRARELGFQGADQGLTAVASRVEGGDALGGSAELERVIATLSAGGQTATPEYYRYAIARLNKSGATTQAVGWMNRYVAAHPSAPTWYEVLVGYGLQDNAPAKLDDQQKLDLFRLLRTANAIPDQYFYTQYAQTAKRAGLPQEALAVAKEAVAKGKLPAASPEAKLLLTPDTRTGSATALEAKAKAASTGGASQQAGDAYLAGGDDAKAAALYRVALTKGGVDAGTVNTRLGIALARSGDRAGALAAFALVQGRPRGDIASFWTTWLNTTPPA